MLCMLVLLFVGAFLIIGCVGIYFVDGLRVNSVDFADVFGFLWLLLALVYRLITSGFASCFGIVMMFAVFVGGFMLAM